MNASELFKLSKKELETYLNSSVHNVTHVSEHTDYVRRLMIKEIEKLFDNSVLISSNDALDRSFQLGAKKLGIEVKVSVKKTGETIQVGRLRYKDVVQAAGFKLGEITTSLTIPMFDKSDEGEYKVKPSTSSYYERIYLGKVNFDKLEDLLKPEVLMKVFSEQTKDWADIRKALVLVAAQPEIKKTYFKPNFNQSDWDRILLETEKNNSELIDETIKKMFNFEI